MKAEIKAENRTGGTKKLVLRNNRFSRKQLKLYRELMDNGAESIIILSFLYHKCFT